MEDRQVIEWDKDDIDALKFMKVDVLALGMLDLHEARLRSSAPSTRASTSISPPSRPRIPRTYAMIRKADTLGIFQIESRAQMSMLPRIKPRTFYDLVIEVAIVRPGPIQGDMVHPYLRRREGKEPVDLSQAGTGEGARQDARRAAVPGTGDAGRDRMRRLHRRRGRSAAPRHGDLQVHRRRQPLQGQADQRHGRATATTQEFAEKTFSQLEGFGSYGFPESHAASFALIAYASSWMKCHHPDVFCAALLNAQPMGFYAPAQIVRDAREHGVEVRPVCINAQPLGLHAGADRRRRLCRPARPAHGARDSPTRMPPRSSLRAATSAFATVDDLWRRAGVPVCLARPARRCRRVSQARCGLARREALWAIKALRDEPLPLFAAASA